MTMAIFNFLASSKIFSRQLKLISTLILSTVLLSTWAQLGTAEASPKSNKDIVKGESGGMVDSQGCGFIANTPNHEINLDRRVDYMRLTVQSAGGQPTLLVLGPNSGDSFCVLGDELSGLKPEISGVWEPGAYKIYIGDRSGSRHQFVLDISTDN